MNITVFRIDDRLIHGQIVTAWIAYADAEQIVIADDKAANDEFQRSLLEMTTPKNVKLQILNVEDALKMIQEDDAKTKTLLLTRGPKEAYQLVEGGYETKEINIGNMNMKKGKTKVLDNLWLDDSEITAFKNLDAKGVYLDVRTVPNDKSQDGIKLLEKKNL